MAYGADRRFGCCRPRSRAAFDPLAYGSDLVGSERFPSLWHRTFLHHFVQPALLRFPGSDDWTIVAALYDTFESAQVELSHLYGGAVAGNTARLEDREDAGFKSRAIVRFFGRRLGENQWGMENEDETCDLGTGDREANSHRLDDTSGFRLTVPYCMFYFFYCGFC